MSLIDLRLIVIAAKKYGVTDIPADVISLVSQATQERLRNIAERLSTIAEHRTEIYRVRSPERDILTSGFQSYSSLYALSGYSTSCTGSGFLKLT